MAGKRAGTVARVATIAVATTPQRKARHWLLHFPDQEPVEVFRSPPATWAEDLTDNPEGLLLLFLLHMAGEKPEQ
jgi:hypothetical protein